MKKIFKNIKNFRVTMFKVITIEDATESNIVQAVYATEKFILGKVLKK